MNYADRVKDTSASVGTGPITLFGAPITGFRSFLSAFPSGAVDVPYAIDDGMGNWEIGIGSFSDSVLTRTQVLSSSSNGGLVDFVAGKKSVICTLPADLVESATNRSIAAASEAAGHAVQTAADKLQTGIDAEAASSAKSAAESAASSAEESALSAADASRLTVGTVTTAPAGSSATATITGQPGAQVLDLTLPAGADGAPGQQGPQGDVGDVNPQMPLILAAAEQAAAAADADRVAAETARTGAEAAQAAVYGDLASSAAGKGAELITYLPAGVGSVATSVQAKLRERISIKDFGAKADDPAYDNYDAIKSACAAISANGGGTLVFPEGRTYYVNRHRIDGGPNANGVTNFTFTGIDGLVIEGCGSKIVMHGGWTRTADYTVGGFTYSHQNQIGFDFQNCSNVKLNNLEIDGGGATITKSATADGISYGVMISGSSYVTLENVYAHNYCTDGLYLNQYGPYTNYIAAKHIHVNNCRFSNNSRQGCSIIQARYVTFTECEFSYTGNNGTYGAHAPAAGVDIEPNYYPGGGAANGDEFTGDIIFNSCRFIDNNGAEYVGTGYVNTPHPVIFNGCTFRSRNAVGTKAIYPFTKTTRFYGCHFDDVGLYPMYGVPDVATDTRLYGCKFTSLSASKSLIYFPTFTQARLVVSNSEFFFNSPTARTQNGLYVQTANCKFTDNYVFVSASEHNGTAWHTVGLLQYAVLQNNKFDTDFATAGKGFVISNDGANESNDNWANPTYLMWYPSTGFPQTTVSRGGNLPIEKLKDWVSGATISFGAAAPTSGTWVRGSVVLNTAPSAGGAPGWQCVTGGAPGTWKAMANLSA